MVTKPASVVWCFRRYSIFLLPVFLMGSVYYTPSFRCHFHPFELTSAPSPPVLVLVWLWPFNKTFDLNLCSSQFNIHGCNLTADRDLYSKADAVLIHHRDITWDRSNLPPSARPPHQKWVWMNSESPSNTNRIPGLENLFNVSLSYRTDSDISVPYGSMVMADSPPKDFIPPEKDKLACWIVSNYNPTHKRLYYYKELQKYVSVHVYGNLFERPISKEKYRDVVSSCKFYLSFENSVHKDYITEKLWNPLHLGAVPLVFGPSRQNYERFIPSDAFIHMKDFPSIRALAAYLLFLDQHEEMYHRYFRWRAHFKVKITSFPEENACRTCDYIRRNRQHQVLKDLYRWFFDTQNAVHRPLRFN